MMLFRPRLSLFFRYLILSITAAGLLVRALKEHQAIGAPAHFEVRSEMKGKEICKKLQMRGTCFGKGKVAVTIRPADGSHKYPSTCKNDV
jgi:hypothetical protein